MTWVAFGEVRPKPTQEELVGLLDRWGDSPGPSLLAALEARASPHPHYLVQPVILDEEWHCTYASKALSPHGPRLLRQIRARARKRSGELITFRQLAMALRAELAEMADNEARMSTSQHEMTDAVKRSKLSIWALKEISPGSDVVVGKHQQLPPSLFMNDVLAITGDGLIVPNPENPLAGWRYHGPRYRQTRFFTEDVLKLWPAHDGAASAGPGDGRSTSYSPERPNVEQPHRDPSIGANRAAAEPAGKRPRFDLGLFRAEYRTRVARWKADDTHYDPPSPVDDCVWAHSIFDRVPRTALRKARRELAPESWTRSGKRTGLKWRE